MIITDVYTRLVEKEFKGTDDIHIISGYGSGGFLKKIITHYPRLGIELYLGMTQEGISSSSHKIFQDLTNSCPQVNVYYQIKDSPNHMKIYKLFRRGKLHKSFVGSSNFTENGFEFNQEILVENDYSYEEIFEGQRSRSLICTDNHIEKYINIHNTSAKEIEESETVEAKGVVFEKKSRYQAINDRLITMRNRADYKYYKEFDVEIIKNNDVNWASTGVNSELHGQTPHIPIGTQLFHNRVFPRDTEFFLVTDTGREFKVTASSSKRDSLYFSNINIYDYLREKIGLKGRRPISRFDLEAANTSHIKFIRLSEYKYYIELY